MECDFARSKPGERIVCKSIAIREVFEICDHATRVGDILTDYMEVAIQATKATQDVQVAQEKRDPEPSQREQKEQIKELKVENPEKSGKPISKDVAPTLVKKFVEPSTMKAFK